jgi:hypothetical protein
VRSTKPKVADTGYRILGQRWRRICPLVILGLDQQCVDFAGIESGERQVEGISVIRSLRASLMRKCPSTTSPSLRAKTGILKQNLRIEEHIRSTTASFLRGLRAPQGRLPEVEPPLLRDSVLES